MSWFIDTVVKSVNDGTLAFQVLAPPYFSNNISSHDFVYYCSDLYDLTYLESKSYLGKVGCFRRYKCKSCNEVLLITYDRLNDPPMLIAEIEQPGTCESITMLRALQ